MSFHDLETTGSIHIPYNWEYANASARTGASGFTSDDLGKFARQLDDDSIWMLTATTPTWQQVSAGSGGVANHASQHESGGADAIKLDDLAAPDDNTDLDATTSAHGLLPKLGGGTTNFLRADGSWAAPSGVSVFTGLTDTPSSYSGQAGKVAAVNTGETALEFADAGGKLSKIFQAVDTTGGMTITNSAQVIELDYEVIKDDYYTHSTTVNPGEVTILQEGWYKITAMMTIASVSASGGIRGNPILNIQIDTGSGFVAQSDQMGTYVREDTTESLSGSVTGVGYFYFSANDKIRLTVYDTVTIEPDEETVAYSQRLIIEYEDRSGTGGSTVDNLKDVGDVDAPAPPGGAKLFFNDTTSKWEDEDLPILRYNEVISEDWAPTWAQLYAHGPVIFGNTSLALTGFVGNATVSTINGLSPTANDSYLVTDSGTLTAGSVAVTAGALVVYNGSIWVLVTPGVGGYALAHMRVQLSTTTPLISPYTDGIDDGKIVYFSGSSNTGIETTLNVTITLPTIASGPGEDGFLRRLYLGNFNGGSDGVTHVNIASSGEFPDGLTEIALEANGASVMLAAINGSLSQTWARISSLESHIQVRRAATWAATNFSSPTAIPFDTQDREGNDAIFNWASTPNPSRINFDLEGHYHISGFANIDSTGGSTWTCEAYLRFNGTTEIPGTRIRTGNYGNEDQEIVLPAIALDADEGDYVEWVFDQNILTGNLHTATLSIYRSY